MSGTVLDQQTIGSVKYWLTRNDTDNFCVYYSDDKGLIRLLGDLHFDPIIVSPRDPELHKLLTEWHKLAKIAMVQDG